MTLLPHICQYSNNGSRMSTLLGALVIMTIIVHVHEHVRGCFLNLHVKRINRPSLTSVFCWKTPTKLCEYQLSVKSSSYRCHWNKLLDDPALIYLPQFYNRSLLNAKKRQPSWSRTLASFHKIFLPLLIKNKYINIISDHLFQS